MDPRLRNGPRGGGGSMTLIVSATVAAALAILGFAAARSVIHVGRRYEEEYLSKAGKMLDSLQASVDPRAVWKASLASAAAGTLAGVAVGGGAIGGVVLGFLGALLPLASLRSMHRRRMKKFQEQLPELISQVRTAVGCGYTLPMAFSIAQKQIPAPVSQELRVLLGHLRLGMTMTDALARLQRRMSNEDLDLFVGAVTLAERSGGQLGSILLNIEQLVRERIRLERKLHSMTARGRMESWIISLAPAGLGAGLYAINPEFMGRFLQHPSALPLLVLGGVWMTIGFLIIRKILTPQF